MTRIKKVNRNKPLTIVSLFSGVGGMDLGFESTGYFESTLCLDNDDDCINSLNINKQNGIKKKAHNFLRNSVIKKADLSEPTAIFDTSSTGEWDVLIGGPPCQSFSVAGSRLGSSDSRGGLISSYLEAIKFLKPRAFVFENVPGFMTIENGDLLEFLKSTAKKMGYSFWAGKLCAADYGDPTVRVRFFMIAVQDPIAPIEKPIRTHRPNNKKLQKDASQIIDIHLPVYVTVKEALAGISSSASEDDLLNGQLFVNHTPAVISRFSLLKPGERDEARRRNRLDPALPALTLFSGGVKGNKGARSHIHPFLPRELTPRECARLHSFPDYWCLSGESDCMLRQISNSVPVKMAEAVARALASSMGLSNDD